MSFLQPLLLWALPLAALPVIIHLISRRRHKIVHWAAMMFLLDARRAAKGLARIRQWLILALRVLAVILIVTAVSRPLLTSGTFRIGGGLDAVFIVLDRSASMEQTGAEGVPKREEGLRRIVEYLQRVGRVRRIVLIDSATGKPLEVETPESLPDLPQTQTAAATADIPALLQEVLDMVEADQIGSAEVWIVSDLQPADWDPASGRWSDLRKQFSARDHIDVRLLAFDEPPAENLSIQVEQARIERAGRNQRELLIDLTVRRDGRVQSVVRVPIEFVVAGARTRYPVELTGRETFVSGISLPIEEDLKQGWGYAEIPGDDQPADNRSFFTFAPPAPRRTVIVSDEQRIAEFWQQAASVANDPDVEHSAMIVASKETDQIEWDDVALVVWQAELPQGETARRLTTHLGHGRAVLFLPPVSGDSNREFLGLRWGAWESVDSRQDEGRVAQWQTKSGLLANDRSGQPLPVDELRIERLRRVAGNSLVSARLGNDLPLLLRPTSSAASQAWWLATLPQPEYSNLGSERIMAYVMLHRALQRAANQLSTARTLVAGSESTESIGDTKRVFPQIDVVSLPATHQAGVLSQGNRLWALNRPPVEDRREVVPDERLHELFAGCRFSVIHNRIDEGVSLAQEMWRVALVTMLLALVIEAALSLPPRRESSAIVQPTRSVASSREVA